MLDWKGEGHFELNGTSFRTMPSDFFEGKLKLEDDDFFIFKPRSVVETYAALIEELAPERIFELGIYGGGSTLFLAELARPRRIVAIDRRPLTNVRERIERHATASGLVDVVRTFEADQGDRRALSEIADETLENADLDLVVDDCSHMYQPTRASFNELFPRLRAGGVYVIEDWSWAHSPKGEEPLDGLLPEEVPLSRLLFEILLAIPSVPGLVTEVAVEANMAAIRRGHAGVDPSAFQISECSNPRGRAMLASSDSGSGSRGGFDSR